MSGGRRVQLANLGLPLPFQRIGCTFVPGQRMSDLAADLREFSRTENQQGNDKNEQHFRQTKVHSETYALCSGSPSFMVDRKPRIPSPKLFPRSPSFLGPKISSAIKRMIRSSGNPNFPNISAPSLALTVVSSPTASGAGVVFFTPKWHLQIGNAAVVVYDETAQQRNS